MLTNGRKSIQDIEQRRAGAKRAFGTLKRRLWGRRDVSLKVKMKVFNAVVLLVLLYGATAWALTRTEEKRLDSVQMKIMRSIIGVRGEDYVRKTDLKKRLCQPPVSMKLRKARLKWFGHVERIEERKTSEMSNECGDGK